MITLTIEAKVKDLVVGRETIQFPESLEEFVGMLSKMTASDKEAFYESLKYGYIVKRQQVLRARGLQDLLKKALSSSNKK